jgi:hypothetical protein
VGPSALKTSKHTTWITRLELQEAQARQACIMQPPEGLRRLCDRLLIGVVHDDTEGLDSPPAPPLSATSREWKPGIVGLTTTSSSLPMASIRRASEASGLGHRPHEGRPTAKAGRAHGSVEAGGRDQARAYTS